MKRKSSIIKLSIIGVAIIIGFILSFCPLSFGFTRFISFSKGIKLGLDLKGGVYAVYEASLKEGQDGDFETAMQDTVNALKSTLDAKGYTESTIVREGTANIRVSVPNVTNPKEVLQIIGTPAQIEFVVTSTGKTVFTGQEIVRAYATTYEGGYAVGLSLNSKGSKAFAEATAENIGGSIDIVTIINGERDVISSPTINAAITGGQAVISGMGSLANAENLAGQITAGKLSLTLTQKEISTVAATLGEKALMYGLIAGAIGLVLIIAFLIFFYGLLGVTGAIAMLIYSVLMIVFLAVFPWVQLTLPGIAGILLSIGMAIDGNIIIYERIKDEYRNGKSILSASYYGFRKSVSAILDGNITTILASVVLLIFGTGAVKGFAITLLIGIVLALFSSLVVTRGLIGYVVNINQTNPKLYKLERGKDYENLSAEQNSAMVDLELQQAKLKKEHSKESNQGGLV